MLLSKGVRSNVKLRFETYFSSFEDEIATYLIGPGCSNVG